MVNIKTEVMKQTAVEWLVDWMGKNQYFIGNDLLKAVEQAKEMEKGQITDAYWVSYKEGQYSGDKTADEYYNQTFKSESYQQKMRDKIDYYKNKFKSE